MQYFEYYYHHSLNDDTRFIYNYDKTHYNINSSLFSEDQLFDIFYTCTRNIVKEKEQYLNVLKLIGYM